MAHEEGDPAEIAKLSGLGKYFNTITTKGRLNLVCATYGTIAVGYLYFKMRSPKEEKPSSSS